MPAAFNYADCTHSPRQHVIDAHRAVWRFIAEPGHWWTGAQSVALVQSARDARTCPLCAERKAALSPYAVTGRHVGISAEGAGVPEAAIEAVHRITTDSSRITRRWVEGLIGEDFGYGHYVELLAMVSAAITVDTVHRALGLPLEPLPSPAGGMPVRYEPPGAVMDEGWVPMLRPETLTDREADLFLGRPAVPNVVRAMSLVPEAVRLLYVLLESHYLPLSQLAEPSARGSSCLTRSQIELLATRTSAMNGCFYCTSAHALMLRNSGSNADHPVNLRAAVGADRTETGIAAGSALVRFAEEVVTEADGLADARQALAEALGPAAVADAAAVIATFERMNRIADGTGIAVDRAAVERSADVRADLGLDAYPSARLPPARRS